MRAPDVVSRARWLPAVAALVSLGCPAAPPVVELPAPPSATAAAVPAPPAPEPLPEVAEPLPSSAPAAPSAFEKRCGWVDNPTPANWWLVDKDASWEIGVQGGHQAEGEMPDFRKAWVETNGHYGHGCACMEVKVDRGTKRVLVYRAVEVLPISRCKRDKRLPPPPG